MDYIIERAKEPSTWRGLALFAGAVGLHIAPDAMPAIGTAVSALISVIEIFRKEK
jgi:hypothetical protein